MRRRAFLQTAGMAFAGGEALAEGKPSQLHAGEPGTKTVLITPARSSLAGALAVELAERLRIVLADTRDLDSEYEVRKADLLDEQAVASVVNGVDAMVHLAEPHAGVSASEQIDYRTRGTYNLLKAAGNARVSAVVYVSSLEVMRGHPDRFAVTEDWRPEPGAAPEALSHYLGEFTCREFAREGAMSVAVLRLGKLAHPGENEGAEATLPALAQGDAVRAVILALQYLEKLSAAAGRWNVFHIASTSTARFPLGKAVRILGYRPPADG